MELAKDCIRACHVLKKATEGTGVVDLSGPSRKRIEDLERCADPARLSLLTIMNDIRAIHRIRSMVSERVDCANDACAHHSGCTEERLIARRTEMSEMLRVFDVGRFQFMITAVSNLLQGDLWRGGALGIDEIIRHTQESTDADPSFLAPVMVRCDFATLPPLTICSM